MPYYCTVPRCTSMAGKAKNVSFHQFPRDEELAKLWNKILKRGKPYTKYSKVCSLHFKPEDYTITSVGKNKGQWRTLRKDAIPSQNLPSESPTPYHRKQWNCWTRTPPIDTNLQQQMAQAIYMQTMLAMQAAGSTDTPIANNGTPPAFQNLPHSSTDTPNPTSYKCIECSKCFKDPDVFVLHKRSHKKEKENFNTNTLRSNPILANLLKTNNDNIFDSTISMENILMTALAANLDYIRKMSMIKTERPDFDDFPSDNVFTHENNAFSPNNNGYTPENNEISPNNGFTPENNDYSPNNNGFTPENNDFSPNNNGFTTGNNDFSPNNNCFATDNNESTTYNSGLNHDYSPNTEISPNNGISPDNDNECSPNNDLENNYNNQNRSPSHNISDNAYSPKNISNINAFSLSHIPSNDHNDISPNKDSPNHNGMIQSQNATPPNDRNMINEYKNDKNCENYDRYRIDVTCTDFQVNDKTFIDMRKNDRFAKNDRLANDSCDNDMDESFDSNNLVIDENL